MYKLLPIKTNYRWMVVKKDPACPIVGKEAGGILASGFTIHTIPLFPVTFNKVPDAGFQYSRSSIDDFSL